MTWRLNLKLFAISVSALLASLTIFLLLSKNAYAELACTACHNMPALDSVAGDRDPVTGAVKGNHSTHATTSVNSCIPCHGAGVSAYHAAHSAITSSGHVPVIKLSSNLNSSPQTGAYSKGTFFNQTSIPAMGTCSNVNCHFETPTPTWGSTTFASPSDCNRCHGAAPADGTHAKHTVTYYGISATTNACVKCHSDHTADSSKFAHATSAGNRGLVVSFAAAPNNGFGRYTGNVSYPKYLPSQLPSRNGTCKNLYCHSPGTQPAASAAAPNQPAVWGASLTCTGCHKSDYDSGSAMSSGSHNMHITGNYSPFGYNLMTCVKCHATTATANLTIADATRHVNGQIEIAFNNTSSAASGYYKGVLATPASPMTKAPGSAAGSCTTVYCHSSGQGADGSWPPTYQSPTWGNGVTGRCGTCHGDQFSHGGFSLGNPLTTGSHAKHLQDGIINTSSNYERCVACHAYGRNAFNPAGCNMSLCHPPNNKKHVNYEINVDIATNYGATATYNGSTRPGAGYSTCSNVSCHYNTTTPAWGTASNSSCFGCHTLEKLGGSHSKHINISLIPTMYNYTANRSTAGDYDFGCSNCHPLATSNHMNGTVNVTLKKDETGAGTLRTKNSATAAGIGVANSGITGTTKVHVFCSAAYCHSNGNAAALVYATTPDWYGGTFTGDRCANCHGNAPNSTIAGSKAHYNNRFLGYTSTVGGHQIGIHAMKIYSSPGGLAKAGTGADSSHGNVATATTISCNICHYATVTTARNDSNPVCAACHYSGNTVGAQSGNLATIADKSKHVNGAVDIAFQPVSILSKAQMRMASFNQSLYSSVWKRNVGYKASGAYDSAKGALNTATMWNGTTKTCTNIACHNGQSVKWSDTSGTTDCISCHNAL